MKIKNMFLVSFFSFCMVQAQPFCGPALQKPSAANTVIVLDLHGPLFQLNKTEVAKLIMKTGNKTTVLSLLFNTSFRADLRKTLKETHVAERIIDKLSKKYPALESFRPMVITMGNTQVPVKEMFDLVQKLKAQGYSVFIASNIGPDMYADLHKKFPQELALFDGAFISSPENNLVEKPRPEYFEQLKIYLTAHGQSGKQILFVDDTQKHVVAAAKQSITSTLFKSGRDLVCLFKKFALI